MVKRDALCEISLEDFEKLNHFHNMRRLMRNEEALRIAVEKYSWRNKNHEESIKDRNALELAIKQFLYFRMTDIEMALFVLGEGNGGKCYG